MFVRITPVERALGACDNGLEAGRFYGGHPLPLSHRQAAASHPKPVRNLARPSLHRKPFASRPASLYGVRSHPALGEYYDDFDGGLGKFKLKNVVKSVKKATVQVAKVAVKPAAIVAASSLKAVGLKSVADKAGKAVGLTQAERKMTSVGGKVIQAGAIVVGGVIAAPYAGAALTAVGHGAATAGGAALGLVKKGGGLFKTGASFLGGLVKKKPASGQAETEQATAQEISSEPGILSTVTSAVGAEAKRFAKKGAPKLLGGLVAAATKAAGSEGSPGSPEEAARAEQAAAQAAGAQAPQGSGGAGGAAPADGSEASPANPLTEAGMFGGIDFKDPKTLLIGAGLSLFFLLPQFKKSKGRRR